MPSKYVRGTIEQRFWAKVDKNGPIPEHCPELGQCWIWIAGRDKCGYGRLNVDRRAALAHRVSYEIHHGPIPEGFFVLHKCDNPACQRDTHHFLGDQAANVADMAKKKRGVQRHTHGRGEKHPAATIPEQVVRKVRMFRGIGMSGREIAKRVGYSEAWVSLVLNGKLR